MDEKLENLIEKLSMLLNSSDKTVKKTETATASKPSSKPVNTKKLERLPELPPRKLIVDKTPEAAVKPQETKPTSKPAEPAQCRVKNITVDWGKRSCSSIRTTYKEPVVERADPSAYAQKHKSSMLYQSQMPNIADEVKIIHGIPLAADLKPKYYMELEGDIHALALIDLDKEGLSEYKCYLNKATDGNPTNNTATPVKTTTDKPVANDQTVSSSTSSISSNSSLKTNDSDFRPPPPPPVSQISKPVQIPNCLDAKTCSKLTSQIEIVTSKDAPKPVPIVKNAFTKSNTNLSKLDQPRNTIINLPSNINRNSIKNKQVWFKDHTNTPPVRHSIATIPDNIQISSNDKGTPLPSTPLPAPVRAMLNNISTLNKSIIADTAPTTPAAFSTPIPVVSLPPLPLPLSKTPPRSSPLRSCPIKQQQQQQNKWQSKVKSPLKIGQTSLKQVENFLI